MNFHRKSPCNDCPYRKDAPIQKWDREEFIKLIKNDSIQFGGIFACHKKDGHVCVGWLMDQYRRNIPCINLRLALLKQNVDGKYLEELFCKTDIYSSIRKMVLANYADLKPLLNRYIPADEQHCIR